MNEQAQRLFVYGTLMPEQPNRDAIAGYVQAAQPATVAGILVDLGAFPALVRGAGIVQGVLLEINPAALETTDRIEGYHSDRVHCLYLREKVTVFLAGGDSVTAWTYFFADPDSITDRPRLIIGEQEGKPVSAWTRR